MLASRTIVASLRTAVYGGLGGWLAVTNDEARGLLDAVLVGAVLADYVTWGIRNVALLPTYIWHGCWEGCVNLAFGYVFYRWGGFKLDGDLICTVTSFLAFLLVAVFKVFYYGVVFVEDEAEDGEA